MAVDITPHLSVPGISQTDEWIQRRKKAIQSLAGSFRKRSGDRAIALGDAVIQMLRRGFAPLPEALRNEVFEAVRKAAPQYVPDKHGDVELGLCTILATMVAVLEQDPGDLTQATLQVAAAVESGSSFIIKAQSAKLETLRRDIVQRFGDVLHNRAEEDRLRWPTPVQKIAEAKPDEDGLAFAKRAVIATQESLERLDYNGELDREEIDLLWWRFNLESSMFGQRFAEMDPALAAVAAGLEVASRLRTTPPGDAHRAVAAGAIPSANQTCELKELLPTLRPHLAQLQGVFAAGADRVAEHPAVFPLLHAVGVSSGENALTTLKAVGTATGRALSFRGWCHRALNEAALLTSLGHQLKLPTPVRT